MSNKISFIDTHVDKAKYGEDARVITTIYSDIVPSIDSIVELKGKEYFVTTVTYTITPENKMDANVFLSYR